MKKALVLGCGRSGKAAAAHLSSLGFEVETAEGYDLVVASPGIQVKSELQLGCEELKRRGWKLLAVTGSKGKSSVVKLVSEALGGVACGNYGLPVSALCAGGDGPGWAVVEASSFQLETTQLPAGTFEAAVVLNMMSDHLDRHGDVSVYHALKRRLATMAKIAYAPFEWERGRSDLWGKSYFDNPVLGGNADAAVALMRAAGLGDEAMKSAFASFKPLAHRFELVARDDGRDIEFIDDSKATSIDAMRAALAMVASPRPVRLIAGGLPKGDDPAEAAGDLTKRVKKVYLIGRSAEAFREAWSAAAECEICGTLEAAVAACIREAKEGETVLLSPAAASFDQFKNFEERGEEFARLVNKVRMEK